MHWACFVGLALVLMACSAASAGQPQGRLEATVRRREAAACLAACT